MYDPQETQSVWGTILNWRSTLNCSPASPGSDYHTLPKHLHQSLLSPISNSCKWQSRLWGGWWLQPCVLSTLISPSPPSAGRVGVKRAIFHRSRNRAFTTSHESFFAMDVYRFENLRNSFVFVKTDVCHTQVTNVWRNPPVRVLLNVFNLCS